MGQYSIVLLGVNHKKTPLEIREKLALTGGYEEPLKKLRSLDGLREYYLLSTCNRVEIYAVAPGVDFGALEDFLSEVQGATRTMRV